MKNYLGEGQNLTIAAPSAVTSGQFILVGAIRGVCMDTVSNGANVAVVREGKFSLPKAAGESWSVGDLLYWDATNSVMTKTAAENTLAGVAVAAAASADTSGAVWIDDTVR